jgi:hypothetical protein
MRRTWTTVGLDERTTGPVRLPQEYQWRLLFPVIQRLVHEINLHRYKRSSTCSCLLAMHGSGDDAGGSVMGGHGLQSYGLDED